MGGGEAIYLLLFLVPDKVSIFFFFFFFLLSNASVWVIMAVQGRILKHDGENACLGVGNRKTNASQAQKKQLLTG